MAKILSSAALDDESQTLAQIEIGQALRVVKFMPDDSAENRLLNTHPFDLATRRRITSQAEDLAHEIRTDLQSHIGIETFLAEFGLSTPEGVALMCLAEALLRIPDTTTIDALIGDKIGGANWSRHIGEHNDLAINASAWALALTGRLTEWSQASGSSIVTTLQKLTARLGQPVLRLAVRQALEIMGSLFVVGETIENALGRAEKTKFLHSFDMLGEAARTAQDAERYFQSYKHAISILSKFKQNHGPRARHGISIKLSALHPRFEPSKQKQLKIELLPKVIELCDLAAAADINLTLDAEEADRLLLSLELFEDLVRIPAHRSWEGFGLAVQAYQKRSLDVIDWLGALARQYGRKLMVRLVKGAYWDSEIKWAQEKGLPGFPVYSCKAATDLSYLASAACLLRQPDFIYPQFATHNPRTALEILSLASSTRVFEFQKLHGMGDSLYRRLLLRQPELSVRVYAPVGQHRDLLPYLVRRLLENGANTSFVHQIADTSTSLSRIVADPADVLLADSPRPQHPLSLFSDRKNSIGLDLADAIQMDQIVQKIAADRMALQKLSSTRYEPSNQTQPIESLAETEPSQIPAMVSQARIAFERQRSHNINERLQWLEAAARALEEDYLDFISLLVREAGKTIADALADVREAVDFCRYYAAQAKAEFAAPMRLPGPTGERNSLSLSGRGIFVCISPWNFPLAIFVGQVTAALAAGNSVIAKPAEQTPIIAERFIRLLHKVGVPTDLAQLAHGPGERIGAALVTDLNIAGVAFTGSTSTAKSIQQSLAAKPGSIVPLIAETGGINAMIVDNSALPEQVVADVITSAFQSAGQRCSALRALFLQDEIADRVCEILKGAMAELSLGDPADPATDIGPLIDEDARRSIADYVQALRHRGNVIGETPISTALAKQGHFVAPIAVALPLKQAPQEEIFGPVLHVMRWQNSDLDEVVRQIKSTGYGLTLGIQSRIDAFIEQITRHLSAGNIYINRSVIGAVVGVQPFGGHGLSGTGPKAGGPYYLHRFATETTKTVNLSAVGGDIALLTGQTADPIKQS